MNSPIETMISTQITRLSAALAIPARGLAIAILTVSLLAGCTQDAGDSSEPTAPEGIAGENNEASGDTDSESEASEAGEDSDDSEANTDDETSAEGEADSEGAAVEEAPPVVGAVITLEPGDGEDAPGEEGEEGKPGPNEVVPIEAEPHILMGQAAPDFSMVDAMTDEPVTLAELEGKTVLVNFWATWCVPCRQEMPWIQSTYEKYQDQGFAVVAVDTAEQIPPEQIPGRVKQYAERTGLTFPMLIDEGNAVGADYGVTSALPISFFVDTTGQVSHHHQGMYPNEVSLEQLVREQMGLDESE